MWYFTRVSPVRHVRVLDSQARPRRRPEGREEGRQEGEEEVTRGLAVSRCAGVVGVGRR